MGKFQTIDFYKPSKQTYQLLPFRFSRLNKNSIILTNLVGEYHITDNDTLNKFVNHDMSEEDDVYKDLRSKHFLVDDKSQIGKNLLSIKYRTKLARLSEFTSLHIFVISLRCEHSCPYCQVSRQSDDKVKFDMSKSVASKS